MDIRIGCSGFYNRHWKDVFYPAHVRQKDWFRYYAQQLNALEINTSFYKFPEAGKLRRWYEDSPGDFRFSVKAPRLITHFKKLRECEQQFADFYEACKNGLLEKLGCVLFQFPPLFSFTQERLELMLCSFDRSFTNIVEFRHASWWNDDVFQNLSKNHIVFCSPSHPGMPDDIIIHGSTAYFRLHGKEKLFYSTYSMSYLEKLADAIMRHQELEHAWIFFNNTASVAGILNAREFQSIINERTEPHRKLSDL